MDLAFGPKEPAGQIVPEQLVAPARANMPLGQAVHVAEAADVRPCCPTKPSTQGVPMHEVWPVVFVKVPLAQSVHVFVPGIVLPAGPNLPILQGDPKHTVEPALGA